MLRHALAHTCSVPLVFWSMSQRFNSCSRFFFWLLLFFWWVRKGKERTINPSVVATYGATVTRNPLRGLRASLPSTCIRSQNRRAPVNSATMSLPRRGNESHDTRAPGGTKAKFPPMLIFADDTVALRAGWSVSLGW